MAKNKPASDNKKKENEEANSAECDLELEEGEKYESGEMLIEGDGAFGYQSRIRLIQKEFNMSNAEVEGINEFIRTIQSDTGMEDVLEALITSDSLNVRQKVAFSHAIGIFRTEDAMNSISRIVTINVPKFHD
jgi:hypothetical protein